MPNVRENTANIKIQPQSCRVAELILKRIAEPERQVRLEQFGEDMQSKEEDRTGICGLRGHSAGICGDAENAGGYSRYYPYNPKWPQSSRCLEYCRLCGFNL